MTVRPTTEIEALRALAHPLRMRILGSLRVEGPATSAILARRLSTDSGQTSHHLRMLHRHGFIDEAPELGKGDRGRERWWKAAQTASSWPNRGDDLGPGGPEVVAALDHAAHLVWNQVADNFRVQVDRGMWSHEWQDAAGFADHAIRTTPERLASLREALRQVIAEHDLGVDPEEPDADTVVVVVQAFPYRETR
ncbi:transcriptional regulator [Actinoplanes ianthinogenes]|uniref:Transcriptional regulator n=1 Tax=Actinoplanes ianthinogenes TaxID=122358 RepID=A0ABM7LLA0_9ACTN|nr:helix-turn-helix domain-containing protein [Actinoplanes ianthinogenes]BCJ40040.1 transcriptional regulator [Actinoplanes ianthinogenes]GGR09862.1 transcriptional regulator [Actinoplanes ianthinogenes]